MIREWIKKLYFRLSPVRRSTDRIEEALTISGQREAAMEARIAVLEDRLRTGEDRLQGLETELREGRGRFQGLETELRSASDWLQVLHELLQLPESTGTEAAEGKTEADYIRMQQNLYNDPGKTPEWIVGNYEWHEEYPYETFLLYRNGDVRKPIFESTSDKVALDFACGPGRMVKRMRRWFREVDGCDISERMIEEARRRVPEANFYVTNGNDLGDVPLEHYDFIYCTISMQHIASHQIRMEIIRQMYAALKPGGKITLQLAYHPDFPYVLERKRMAVNECQIKFSVKTTMADWDSDDFDAATTNGGHDVGIGEKNLDRVKEDFSGVFRNVSVWFGNVSNYYKDLDGKHHGRYWATDWVFIHGEKDEN